MAHATELRGADDVVQTNGADFARWGSEIRGQVIAGRMRSLFVVMPTPDSADVIQVFFGHDDKLVQTFKLKSLDESLDVGPQIG